ncbi:hypothetical protein [Sphingomonas phyllosphaerae]|uniref:hypothetical protein n=1 Tax=Sphingomonas phyllosphaerae TaxID=257003 RepID=UPI0012DBF57F|nr:hypothetical protein [Sphingomonas phyllosphaerae]
MTYMYNLAAESSAMARRGFGVKTMPRAAAERRLRGDLARARRARGMINDPLSMNTLSDYITELEDQLLRGSLPFVTGLDVSQPMG